MLDNADSDNTYYTEPDLPDHLKDHECDDFCVSGNQLCCPVNMFYYDPSSYGV